MAWNNRKQEMGVAEDGQTERPLEIVRDTESAAPAVAAAPAVVPAAAPAVADTDAPVDDLRTRLVELQATVERLVTASEPTLLRSGDPEIDSAARTLRFAQQTADAVIAEARNDASGIVADAERQRGEIIRRARQQADEDYSAERSNVQRASAAWQAQRIELIAQLDMLVALSAKYRDGLDHLDAGIRLLGDRLKTGAIAEMVSVDTLPEVEQAPAAEAPAAAPAAEAPVSEAAAHGAPPVSHVAKVDAGNDPFVFDAGDPSASAEEFGWSDEPPAGSTTTF